MNAAAGIPAAAGLPARALMVQSGREPLLVRHAHEKLLPEGQGEGRDALFLCCYLGGHNGGARG